ncbi:MAG TPA: hypothetical protein VF557_08040 [Jatrophihabitans sp.]|uniref:hypothetical protein n=1 Tax=Jatrophihabitans sp. TaxID=1932789 RepID=UPI002F005485
MKIPAEEPGHESEETDYTVPDYGQKGTNRDPVHREDAFQEEVVDYQQRGTGYVPPGEGQPDGVGGRADADDAG